MEPPQCCASSMPLFQNDGLELAYEDIGAGPALVLIHGWAASGREWRDHGWVERLSGRRLLMLDVRGHGRSAKPHSPEAYAVPKLAGDMIALMTALALPEADVFGYSMGATIALGAAVLAPSRVRSLVDGAAPADPLQVTALGRALQGRGEFDPVRLEAYRAYALQDRSNDLPALSACLEAGLGAPPCEELAIFGGEALIAVGTRDRRFEVNQRLSECLPGGRFLALEEADHMGAFSDERFQSAVVGFLDEVSPR